MIPAERIVFVGGKPFMNYVTAVVMQFTTNGAGSVVIRSRGKFISRAVDVAEMVRTKFLTDSIKIGEVVIAAEDFKNKEGRPIRVSTIDIHLDKLTRVNPTPTTSEIILKKEEPKVEEAPAETVAEETAKEEPAVEETPVEAPVVESEVKEEPKVKETSAEEPVTEPETPAETEQTDLTPKTSE